MTIKTTRPPKENLVRAVFPGPEFREEPGDDTIGTLEGRFAVWNQWTEINSSWEGNFLERVSPTAFTKTVQENTPKVLFQHGHDPQVGDKPLGPIRELRADDEGMYYEVGLLDTSYNRDILPGLKAGLYGASFRFSVVKEEFNRSAKKSAYNPKGLPERTILEATLPEFGPVTFPAYQNATAGARSMTDEFILTESLERFIEQPELLRAILEQRGAIEQPDEGEALPADGAATEHSDEGSRSEPQAQPDPPPAVAATTPQDPPAGGSLSVRENQTVNTIEEVRARIDEIKSRFTELDTEIGINRKTEEQETEWSALLEEKTDLEARVEDYEARKSVVREAAEKPKNVERGVPQFNTRGTTQSRVPANIYELSEYRNLSSNDDQMRQALKDGAMRSVESATLPHPKADDRSKAHIENLIRSDESGSFAQRILATGSPTYQRAFSKLLAGQQLTSEESRAIGTVGSAQNADGGYAVPYTLDPTIILTSNGQVNPLRSMARVETLTTGNTWKGVTSAGISVSRVAEETAVSPTSPTLAQPSVTVQAVKAEILYSIEADGDWPRLQAEMARLLQDAKDAEEATQFITGNGNGTTGNPEGVVAGLASTSHVGTTGNGLTVDDIFRLQGELPDRFEPRAQFLAHRAVYNAIRQFGTGSSVGEGAVWQNSLQPGQPGQLIGYPARTASGMSSDYTTNDELVLLFGDFQNGYIIVDKVGLSVEIDPHVRDGNGAWTGQRAILAHYRNNGMVLVDNALRLLKIGVLVS